jgi:tRNA A58 N-methylase Trm61
VEDRALHAGERVLLVDSRNRRYLLTLASGKLFHTHLGSVAHDDLIGAPEGSFVASSGGGRRNSVKWTSVAAHAIAKTAAVTPVRIPRCLPIII